jgi:hypothetical protein
VSGDYSRLPIGARPALADLAAQTQAEMEVGFPKLQCIYCEQVNSPRPQKMEGGGPHGAACDA